MKKLLIVITLVTFVCIATAFIFRTQTASHVLTVRALENVQFDMVKIVDGKIAIEKDLVTPYESVLSDAESYMVFRSKDPTIPLSVDARTQGGGGVTGSSSVVIIYKSGDQVSTVALD